MAGVTDDDIQQFMALANCSLSVAQQYLSEFGDISKALDAYYAAGSDPNARNEEIEKSSEQTLSRTPLSRPSSSTSAKSQSVGGTRKTTGGGAGNNSKFMSFSDMVRGQADEDDEDDQNRNTFAGGETSGLEVTDPNDSNSLIKDLLEKARKGGQQQTNDSAPSTENKSVHHFVGKGYRLGSVVDTPNQVVEDLPEQPLPSKPKKVTREITFWKEGFQVGDGPLYRYDDPANSFYLKELNQGRAPLKLLNVEFGQEVDVNVYKKLEVSYTPPKTKMTGFQGQGQRLGSPIPGESETSSVEPTIPGEFEVLPKDEIKEEKEQTQETGQSKGDVSVQIRYASGKREVLHCNSTDSVQFLYDYVKDNTQDKTRRFTLNYAFPVKPLENFDATLAEADLINTVVVQRWA